MKKYLKYIKLGITILPTILAVSLYYIANGDPHDYLTLSLSCLAGYLGSIAITVIIYDK